MSQPIEYIENDAGFSKTRYVHGNGRKVRHPNTQVAALAIFDSEFEEENTSYDEMFVALSLAFETWVNKPGRRSKVRKMYQGYSGTLHSYRLPMEFLKPWINERWPSLLWVSTTWVGAKEQMHLDEGVFPDGEAILARVSSDQVIPVIRGIAHFPWDPNSSVEEGKSRIVYGYWTMP